MGLLSYYLIFSCLSLNVNENERNDNIHEISLLICAKNELTNLKLHLPIWINQTDIHHQVIIVNDNSTDSSKEWLTEQVNKYDNLKVLHLDSHEDEVLKGKRFALFQGLKLVDTAHVVFTDADCFPKSTLWLRTMANAFKENTSLVLGYSPYQTSNNLLGKLIDYETVLTAFQYLSFARMGLAYMGVGRNIAYKTEVLKEQNFIASNQSIGGDDDLLVATISHQGNTEIVLAENSFVYTLPELNFKDWMNQKIRHFNTAKHYNLKNMIVAGGYGTLNSLFYLSLITIFLIDFSFFPLLILYLFKQLLFLITNYWNLRFFKLDKIVSSLWYIDLLFIVVFIFFHLISNFVIRDAWNKK